MLAHSVAAEEWAPHLDVAVTWHDNASNANLSADRISAFETTADLTASDRIGFGRSDSLHLTAHVGSSWFPRHPGLRQHAAGARAEWQHKFGLGALAPVLAAEVSVDGVAASESDRYGTSSGVLITLRKRFDADWRATLSQDFAQHDARFIVFDRRSAETALAVDRPLGDTWHLTIRGSYRDGDILSYATPPRPELVALAPNRAPVTTFGRSMVAYSIEARTFALGVTLSRPLGQNSAARLSVERRNTRHSPLSYENHLVSLGFAHQF